MKQWLGYILFGIGAVVVFLYLLFPAKSVKAYFAYKVAQIDPQLRLTAKDPILRLPPGIKLRNAEILFDKTPLIRWESLSFFPRINAIFSPQKIVRYRGRAYQGEATGDVFLVSKDDWRIKGAGDGFQAELMPLATIIPQGSLTGTIAGRYDLTLDHQGTLGLAVSNGSLTLNEPLLQVEAVNFDQVTLDAVIEQDQIRINAVQMTGPDINCDLAGQVILRRPLDDSIIDITGTIKPHPLFLADLRKKLPPGFLSDQIAQKGVAIKINGTIKTPEVSF